MGCASSKELREDNSLHKSAANIKDSSYSSSTPHLERLSSDKDKLKSKPSLENKKEKEASYKNGNAQHIAAHTFTFKELAAATKNFRAESLLGEGGFGRVYKGRLESTGQIVAVKQLDRNGVQGNREFLVEVLMLSLLHHSNLVNLIGYCADGDQRLLVYEFMPLGSLEDHLHDLPPDREPLDWNTRMKIAAGAARGLEYLHDKANPPVIYRDLKSSNILLGEDFHPKLSDFGLAKLGPVGDKTHVSTRVMGTYGYCAPEYAMTGQLTLKSDVYSFGVVLLELITGRKAIDNTKAAGEHNLVAWARPLFKDRRKFPQMADPMLQGRYPMRGLYQALAVAAMCLQEQATHRPLIGDVVTALTYLASQTYDPGIHPVHSNRFAPSTPGREKKEKEKKSGGSGEADYKGARQGSLNSPQAQGSPDKRSKDRLHGRVLHAASNLEKGQEADGSKDSPGSSGRHLRSMHRLRTLNGASDLTREQNGGSGRRMNNDSLEGFEGAKDSPGSGGRTPRSAPRTPAAIVDRERAVAEARSWGENWRDKRRGNLQGSFESRTGV